MAKNNGPSQYHKNKGDQIFSSVKMGLPFIIGPDLEKNPEFVACNAV